MMQRVYVTGLAGVLGVALWAGAAASARAQFQAGVGEGGVGFGIGVSISGTPLPPPAPSAYPYQPQPSDYDMGKFFYYPYYYYPHNYWPLECPKWPERPGQHYMRPPAYMTYPPFIEPHWRNEWYQPQPYYRGFHFWLDQF